MNYSFYHASMKALRHDKNENKSTVQYSTESSPFCTVCVCKFEHRLVAFPKFPAHVKLLSTVSFILLLLLLLQF